MCVNVFECVGHGRMNTRRRGVWGAIRGLCSWVFFVGTPSDSICGQSPSVQRPRYSMMSFRQGGLVGRNKVRWWKVAHCCLPCCICASSLCEEQSPPIWYVKGKTNGRKAELKKKIVEKKGGAWWGCSLFMLWTHPESPIRRLPLPVTSPTGTKPRARKGDKKKGGRQWYRENSRVRSSSFLRPSILKYKITYDGGPISTVFPHTMRPKKGNHVNEKRRERKKSAPWMEEEGSQVEDPKIPKIIINRAEDHCCDVIGRQHAHVA